MRSRFKAVAIGSCLALASGLIGTALLPSAASSVPAQDSPQDIKDHLDLDLMQQLLDDGADLSTAIDGAFIEEPAADEAAPADEADETEAEEAADDEAADDEAADDEAADDETEAEEAAEEEAADEEAADDEAAEETDEAQPAKPAVPATPAGAGMAS